MEQALHALQSMMKFKAGRDNHVEGEFGEQRGQRPMNIDYFLNLPVKALIALGSSFSLLIAVLIGIFLAYRKLEIMESLLNNCRFIKFHSKFWGNSPRERMARLCAVYVAIALPKLNNRRGLIDLHQVRAFPRSLKLALHGMNLIDLIGAVGGTVYYVIRPT